MSTYTCKLGTSDGRILIQEHEAAEPASLRNSLESQGYFVFDVSRKPFRLLSGSLFVRPAISTRAMLHFNQELLVLIKAGMPMMQVIDTVLERLDRGVLAEALHKLRDDIKGGAALSTALERHGRLFPNLYVASIRAGERTGDLPDTLQRYIQYLSKVDEIRKKIVSALFYPCILVAFSVLVTGVMLFFVIPVVSRIFAESGAELPVLTRVLISLAGFLRGNIAAIITAIAAAVAGFRFWTSRESGRYFFNRLLATAPYFGRFLREYSLAGFSRTLASLLGSGMPIIEALRMANGTLNNVYLEERLAKAVREIEEGGRLSAAFERTGIIPPLMIRMLGVGETTGALEEMLNNISEYLEKTLDERLHIITSAIEPVIMVGMGLVIGAIVVAMYLPIFQIAGTVG